MRSQPAMGAQYAARLGRNRHCTFQGTRGKRKFFPFKMSIKDDPGGQPFLAHLIESE